MNESDYQVLQDLADKQFVVGEWPKSEDLAKALGKPTSEVIPALLQWQKSLAARAVIVERPMEPSESFRQAVSALWKDAVSVASAEYKADLETVSKHLSSSKEEDAAANLELQNQVEDLQALLASVQQRAAAENEDKERLSAELVDAQKQLDVKNNEIAQGKERLTHHQNELTRMQKQWEETRDAFETRLKEEQHHHQDQLARLESELRSSRMQSQNRSDEHSKSESALNKQINDLQTELAKRDLKVESLTSQSRSVEGELKKIQTTQGGQQQSMTQMRNQLLAETNKSNRLSEKIEKLTKELGVQQQQAKKAGTEAASRESKLRQDNQKLTSELNGLNHQLSIFEKKLSNKEDQLKKLKRSAAV